MLIIRGDNNGVASPAPVYARQIRGQLFYAAPYVADGLGNADRDLWMTVAAAGQVGLSGLFIFRPGPAGDGPEAGSDRPPPGPPSASSLFESLTARSQQHNRRTLVPRSSIGS
ncbi:hypothetical protein [Arthrobacter sp. ZGTC131]|uniref:hypothetical protein n=1 Tax=Arthrobacter sp. ZGTC131 TaxID=2058898 RepID=UPI000CE39C40|nr:hypothetical protein [Arthrobacter sp. ZGTC131]